MDLKIEFNQSAFRHNATKPDIRFAIDTAIYDASIDADDVDNKFLIIGFDSNANLLEVMYNVVDEGTINVFHAMRCRKQFLHLINTKG
ncbi:hypothetical protein R80B4_00140 [Fibrobacteres bacterium R8-0-B4]